MLLIFNKIITKYLSKIIILDHLFHNISAAFTGNREQSLPLVASCGVKVISTGFHGVYGSHSFIHSSDKIINFLTCDINLALSIICFIFGIIKRFLISAICLIKCFLSIFQLLYSFIKTLAQAVKKLDLAFKIVLALLNQFIKFALGCFYFFFSLRISNLINKLLSLCIGVFNDTINIFLCLNKTGNLVILSSSYNVCGFFYCFHGIIIGLVSILIGIFCFCNLLFCAVFTTTDISCSCLYIAEIFAAFSLVI